MMEDRVLFECLDFLDYCEMYGKEIKAREVDPLRLGLIINLLYLNRNGCEIWDNILRLLIKFIQSIEVLNLVIPEILWLTKRVY